MSATLDAARQFLTSAGFEIHEAPPPLALTAQNASCLIFLAATDSDPQDTSNRVTNILAGPFQSKRFGPKTMEMYCVLVSDADVPLPIIERCELDTKVCRKIVIAGFDKVNTRLSFLSPMNHEMAAPLEPHATYWAALAKRLTPEEEEFLSKVENLSADTETVLELARRQR